MFCSKSLISDLESNLNGNFGTLTVMLTRSMVEFLSIEIHEILVPRGTDQPSLTEVFMSRSNQELKEINDFYLICKNFARIRYKMKLTT